VFEKIVGIIIAVVVAWGAILAFALITGEAEGDFDRVALSAFLLAVIAVAGFITGGDKPVTGRKCRGKHLISCMKCGYIGAGSGSCPRCGWNRTRKLTAHTTIVSCKKCGYLGAGSGSCPRCGSNWAEIINK